MAGSTSRFKPAEEQFIEQTPWANPQHPSHAHLLQRQTSAQQVPRTSSPFAQDPQTRRHSDQQGPASGTFSGPSVSGPTFSTKGPSQSTQSSPPLLSDGKQTSLSPAMTRPKMDDTAKVNGASQSVPLPGTSFTDKHRELNQEVRRERAPATSSHF